MDSNKKRLSWIALFVIVTAVFLFLRFYLLDQRIIFDWDQERDAYQIHDLITQHKPTLIGPRVVGEEGFFLAPYYTYLLTPFYLLSHLHPVGELYLIVFYNLLFVGIGFLVIRKLFGTVQAISFLALWGVNVLLVNYDIIAWNPLLIPLWIIFTWWTLYEIYHSQKLWQWALLGLLLGTGINFHVQFVFIILFSLLMLGFSRKVIKLEPRKILLLLGSFLVTFTPLLFFDLRHDFLNFKLFISFFFSAHSPKDYFAWFPVLDNVLEPLLFKISFTSILFYAFITGAAFYLYQSLTQFKKAFYFATGLLFIITLIGFSIYGKRPSEYYFLFLYPFIFVTFTQLLVHTKKTILLYMLVPFLIITNYPKLVNSLKTNQLGLYHKNHAVKFIKQTSNISPVSVSFNTLPGRDTGFRYLIDLFQIPQSTSPKVFFEVNVPPKNSQHIYGGIGIKETKVK